MAAVVAVAVAVARTVGELPAEPDAEASRSGSARPPVGVRVRILATVLVLTALAMTSAGGVWVLVQRAGAYDRADSTIARDVAEFRTLALTGAGPGTSHPFTSVDSLLRAALARQVPADDETFLGLIDGEPALAPSGRRPVKLEDELSITRQVARLSPNAPVQIRQASTSAGEVRYIAVQVRVVGQPQQGTYVVAILTSSGQRVIMEGARQYALVALGSLILVGLVGWLVAGRLLRPLRLLREAAEHISHTDLSLRIPVSGNDDISDLTRTVNDMLERLQAGFAAQQRFLDDAGHELRTPVTIVSGHLEMLDPADPREVAEVRALALDELDRMGRLIRDLTLLAKARRPDFVRPGLVDLAGLTDDVVDKASALGHRRWTVDSRASQVISADAQRLTQALLQLADNAVRHTAEDDEIAVGSSVSGGLARLWVRDTGPGVAPEDAERIFERFGTAAAAAGRRQEGSGLGLAIVTAIAEGHGGRVHLASVPGHGATFSLILPGAVREQDGVGSLASARGLSADASDQCQLRELEEETMS